jgi:hypothetical protein
MYILSDTSDAIGTSDKGSLLIRLEVALPTTTRNGNFYMPGGGGFNGSIPSLTKPLALHYRVRVPVPGSSGAEGKENDPSLARLLL